MSVQLYVYDLSNGLARQLSQQLTGRQIDGIWHTSIVVFGKEIFYGQGISITAPGKSHHGNPHQTIDMGETALDEETLNEYIDGVRDHYTADKYHLLDFNCNSFTNDLVGFLTGGSIPDFIKDLPTDFLSTPFGAALRPTIDNMYRRPVPGTAPPSQFAPQASNPDLASTLLQAVASRAASGSGQSPSYLPTPAPTSPSTPSPMPATQTIASPIHLSTNPASFSNVLRTHRALVAFFTSATCGPCRMIEPVFEELASAKANSGGGIAFTKIDLAVGMGNNVAAEYGVRVTPTFLFFLDGKKTGELKGVNAPELRTQVDLLLYEAFPPHRHISLSIPAVEALSLNPILFSQVPALDSVNAKFSSFIDGAAIWPATAPQTKEQIKQTLSQAILPYLKAKFPQPSSNATTPSTVQATAGLLVPWARMTATLVEVLSLAELFPLVDMWRLALLDPSASSWCASLSVNATSPDPIALFLAKATAGLAASNAPRNYILTVLRMLSNAFSNTALTHTLLSPARRAEITGLLVTTLLHEDATVRTAAASLAFNVATYLQKGRVEKLKGGNGAEGTNEDGDWEVELMSAVIEAIDREKGSEEVVHRLTACLALVLHLSPFYDDQLSPLLEMLQAQPILKSKLEKGGCGESGVQKKDVRKLVEEVSVKLCPS